MDVVLKDILCSVSTEISRAGSWQFPEYAYSDRGDCLEEAIAERIRLREAIPQPSRLRKAEYSIQLSALMAAKTALYLAMKESGLTNVQLARKLKCDEKRIRGLIDPRHKSKIDRIEAALEMLGKRLVVGYRAAVSTENSI